MAINGHALILLFMLAVTVGREFTRGKRKVFTLGIGGGGRNIF